MGQCTIRKRSGRRSQQHQNCLRHMQGSSEASGGDQRRLQLCNQLGSCGSPFLWNVSHHATSSRCTRVIPHTIAVCLHVTGSGLDEWCRNVSSQAGQNLVADKESAQVVVVVEDIHDALVSLVLRFIPLRLRHARSLDVRVESVKVEPDVDSGVSERVHAVVMLSFGVDVVYADRIGTEGLHEVGIALALVAVDERVVWEELVGDACGE